MTARLFNRRAQLFVGSNIDASPFGLFTGFYAQASVTLSEQIRIAFSGDGDIRLRFRIQKNPEAQEANTAEIEVFNLSEHTRGRLNLLRVPISLEAGYEDDRGVIFDGHSTNIVHSREGADWVTRILTAEGVLENQAQMNQVFKGGVPPSQIMNKICDALQKQIRNFDTTQARARAAKGDFRSGIAALLNGFVANGPVMKVLDDILKRSGFEASVQNGSLQLLAVDEPSSDSALVLSPSTGLIGKIEPVKDAKAPGVPMIKAKSLLRHRIFPGAPIEIQSKNLNGFFKVRKVEHRGDTHGAEWETEFEARAASLRRAA